MRQVVQKLYFNTWVRVPAKLVITFALMKIGWDYSEYLTKWRRKNTQPRWVACYAFSANSTCSPQQTLGFLAPITGTLTTKAIRYLPSHSGHQKLASLV